MKKTYHTKISDLIGENVILQGWVHAIRDMGKVLFLDLRDSTGIVQVVFAPRDTDEDVRELVKSVRPEYVVEIHGIVQKRAPKQVNPELKTGTVEVLAKQMSILNSSKTPPFELDKDTQAINDELRLKYRYLDLRTERMLRNLTMRHKVFLYIRNYLSTRGFLEVNTPILTKSTPEGARDYLVPSRVHKGKFFALPQSPQQYKQLLMVAGIEKYFQIAPCFRDEDSRADRSPADFYQVDIEMSFIQPEDIMNLVEDMFSALIGELFPTKHITQIPWPHISWHDSMEKYGNDKPDIRKDKNDSNELGFSWIVDWPMFQEQKADDFFHGVGKKIAPMHHMFVLPREEDLSLLDSDPLKVTSTQYDLALNGYELSSGSLRIHDPKIQEKVFDIIGFTKEDTKNFQHLLTAFEYGVPPHGGIAPGLDRFLQILLGEKGVREVIAFPLSGDVRDPLMGAPSTVTQEQLNELGIELKK